MLEHFRQIHSLLRIDNKALFDEVLGVRASLDVIRELESASFDLLVGLLHLLRLEGRSPVEHRVEDHADGPEIHLVAVTISCVKHLWGQIVWCATNCALTLAIVEHLGCKAKVADFQAHAICKEKVPELEISVDHFVRVNILHCFDKLVDVVASLHLVQPLPSLDEIRQRLVLADIEHDVDVLLVLEVAVEPDDVLVVQRAMDLDLAGQLLPCLGSCQICLWHNFECPRFGLVLLSLDWFESAHLVALRESTLQPG